MEFQVNVTLANDRRPAHVSSQQSEQTAESAGSAYPASHGHLTTASKQFVFSLKHRKMTNEMTENFQTTLTKFKKIIIIITIVSR